MVTVRELNDQAALEQLVSRQPLNPFLQAWAWGEFQSHLGRPMWRLGAYDGSRFVGAALVIEHQLILGRSYLYCPRGPLAESAEAWTALVERLRELGQREQVMYVKIDPNILMFDQPPLPRWAVAGTTLQPRRTWIIDTARLPAEELAASHQKTRYNIRLAEKRGVTVRWSTEDRDRESFLELMAATYKRQEIRLHPLNYYRQEIAALKAAQMMEFGIAEYQGRALTANMVIWHGQTATYLHGGSSDEHKDMMAPHLLQWRTIERAHERGVKEYDLWGIAPADEPNHRWQGVSRFKRGFAGREIEFPASINIVIQPQWYQAYRLAKRFRGGVDE